MALQLTAAEILPEAGTLLLGRVWSRAAGGPCPVLLRGTRVLDLTPLAPTLSGLLERDDLPDRLAGAFPDVGPLDGFLDDTRGQLLAPCDLQAIKAAGVTFAGSMIERVIEERAKGDPARAEAIRSELAGLLGGSLKGVVPGSEAAAQAKARLQAAGMWSQYLEVGIGPDAEIFTKAQPMSALGCGAEVGVHRASHWNNPEPEVVLAVNSRGRICGATLGNDVNLRDVEGRSALLLGKAKDNNGAAAIGPFLRLFDDSFTLATVEKMQVTLKITGTDGFTLEAASDMGQISRPPAQIVAQAIGPSHQYPDGLMLYLGTMFAPTKDRDAPGQGFTHHPGDVVEIAAPPLGRLVNVTRACDEIAPWTFGTGALMKNLAGRGLL
jgi:fumarylacetoacetate (FAA) hydrolase family protein